jgi:hypothetical protein
VSQEHINCQTCTKIQKKLRGCEGGVSFRIYDVVLDKCPAKYITSETALLLELFYMFQKGFLPVQGPYLEQYAKHIETFKFLDVFLSKLEEQRMKSMQTGAKNVNRIKH